MEQPLNQLLYSFLTGLLCKDAAALYPQVSFTNDLERAAFHIGLHVDASADDLFSRTWEEV